jgi:tetratricopeptide (TPR) repeat protein
MKKSYSFLIIIIFIAFGSKNFSQNLADGIKLLKNESYQKAISTFKSYISISQTKGDGYFYLGKTYFKLDNTDSAKICFQKGTEVNKDYALNFVGLGGIALAKGDTNTAISEFNKALDITSDDPSIYVNIGDMYLISHYIPVNRANDFLDQAIALDKHNTAACIKKGDLYLSLLNNGTQAIANYQNAINYDSSQVDAYIGLGNVYTAVRNYQEAESYYKIAAQRNPDYSVTYRYLADLYTITKENDKAVEAYKKYISLSESSISNLKKLSILLYNAGQYKDCVEVIKGILQSEKEDTPLLHLLAFTYSQLEDTANGISAFQQYMETVDKKDISVTDYELLSKLYEKENQDSLAIEALKNAFSIDSTRLDLVNTIKMINFKDRNWPGVISIIKMKESVQSLNAQDYFDLGKAYYFDKDYGLADTAFLQLVKLKPDLAIGYRWVAAAKANLDPDSEQGLAKDDYEKFISLAQNDTTKYKTELVEAYSYLGYYYFIKKDMESSKLYWQKVYALDPTNPQAIEAIKKIK